MSVTDVPFRTDESVEQDPVLRIVKKHSGARGALIAVLGDIQDEYGYLPEAALRTVAERMGLSLVDVYGVATFYRSFSLRPRGRHLILVCVGTACHVRGAPMVVEELERRLRVRVGETTPDKEFTLETVNCLGICALGPMVVVDGRYYSNVRSKQVGQILEEARSGPVSTEKEDRTAFPVELICPHCRQSLMDDGHSIEGRASIRLEAPWGSKRGCLRLSAVCGSQVAEWEQEMPEGAVAGLSCPRCRVQLPGSSICPGCGALMVITLIRGGGALEICPRVGCKEQRFDVNHFGG